MTLEWRNCWERKKIRYSDYKNFEFDILDKKEMNGE
jgi:hypothetical protein